MKLNCLLFFVLLFCRITAQTVDSDPNSFYKDRILKAPESVFKKFKDAGMNPSEHILTTSEQEKVDQAFTLLPPLYKKILKEYLQSISFMDNMPNTALTSTLETVGSTKQFNITFRAGILNESISEWATWKESSLYDTAANPALKILIDAGNLDAFVYVLLHEATHIVDAVLKLTPDMTSDSLVEATAITKNVWQLFNTPVVKFTDPLLEKTRFRGGTKQPITSASEIYNTLRKTPFASLYGMSSWHEDIAELITIYYLTSKLSQPFVIYIEENGKIISKFEPMANKLVKRRLKQLQFIFT